MGIIRCGVPSLKKSEPIRNTASKKDFDTQTVGDAHCATEHICVLISCMWACTDDAGWGISGTHAWLPLFYACKSL